MKIEKIDFSAKNSKKFVYYNEELVHKFKFQTQLSRKLQRFRTCRKNKKCSIFHDLSEYIIFSYDCNLLNWFFNSDFTFKVVGVCSPNPYLTSNMSIDQHNSTYRLKKWKPLKFWDKK